MLVQMSGARLAWLDQGARVLVELFVSWFMSGFAYWFSKKVLGKRGEN